ncbi:unnamed protein product [Brassica oleracea var. botrytis]
MSLSWWEKGSTMTASSFSQAHVFVSGGGAFIGLRLGVCHCDGLPDSFLCFLTALASSEWCGLVPENPKNSYLPRPTRA